MSVGAGTILANGKDPQIVIAVHIDLRSYGVCENGMLITGKLLTHGFGMDLDGFRWFQMDQHMDLGWINLSKPATGAT